MAKRTAIIDIGSNSVRMAIYEKTSRFAFHLIKEIKSKVRISEGAYEADGYLQKIPMQRAYESLQEFKQIINALKCKKTLCVATSALRDAPNKNEFLSKIQKELSINIKVIDGEKEAFFGGIAGANLLYIQDEATTIDIGGGSTELAKIKKGKVVDTISINLGTVRLKELFFDKKRDSNELFNYINSVICEIPPNFNSNNIIVIGGTLRALSSAIMSMQNYPLQTIHGFSYDIKDYIDFIYNISNSSILKLNKFDIKKDRYDTIREGSAIFYSLIKTLGAKKIISSGAGVREGVYLCDLLRTQNYMFPENFNLSVKSMQDRFVDNLKSNNYIAKKANELFDTLAPLHGIDEAYKYPLRIAAKLYNVGQRLNFYQYHLHGYYFLLNNLNFGFTHEQKILIALLLKSNSNKLPKNGDLKEFNILLPNENIVKWLSFILSFARNLNLNLSQNRCSFRYKNNTLHIKSESPFKLAKEATKKLVKPTPFAIIYD